MLKCHPGSGGAAVTESASPAAAAAAATTVVSHLQIRSQRAHGYFFFSSFRFENI